MEDSAEFAQARQAHLRRMAFLLCGNWHDAQDVTQTALMDLCGAWNQARRADSIDAYAHRVLVRTYLSQRRKVLRQQSRAAEYALANERTAASPEQPELRMALLAALAQVPPRGRAVLILRFWEDGVPHPELAAKYAQAMAAADKLPTTISPSRFTVEAAGGQASVDVNYWPPTDGHHPPSDPRCVDGKMGDSRASGSRYRTGPPPTSSATPRKASS